MLYTEAAQRVTAIDRLSGAGTASLPRRDARDLSDADRDRFMETVGEIGELITKMLAAREKAVRMLLPGVLSQSGTGDDIVVQFRPDAVMPDDDARQFNAHMQEAEQCRRTVGQKASDALAVS